MVSVFPFYFNEGGIVAHGYNNAATVENNEEKNGDGTQGFASWKRCFSISEAPAGAKYLRLMLRKYNTKAGNEDSWMFAARGQVEEVGAAASQPGPWTVGPSGARFGENIFGQAQTEDIAPYAATEVIETRVAGPVSCNSLIGHNKRVAKSPEFSCPVPGTVVVQVSFDAESTPTNYDWSTRYGIRVWTVSPEEVSYVEAFGDIGGARGRYTSSVTFSAPAGVKFVVTLDGGYNTTQPGATETNFWNIDFRVEIIKV